MENAIAGVAETRNAAPIVFYGVSFAFDGSECLASSVERLLLLPPPYRLENFEALELGMIQIQRLVIPGPAMRCPERFRFGPGFKHRPAFPNRMRRVERMILAFGAFEKVKFYKTSHLVQMTVA